MVHGVAGWAHPHLHVVVSQVFGATQVAGAVVQATQVQVVAPAGKYVPAAHGGHLGKPGKPPGKPPG